MTLFRNTHKWGKKLTFSCDLKDISSFTHSTCRGHQLWKLQSGPTTFHSKISAAPSSTASPTSNLPLEQGRPHVCWRKNDVLAQTMGDALWHLTHWLTTRKMATFLNGNAYDTLLRAVGSPYRLPASGKIVNRPTFYRLFSVWGTALHAFRQTDYFINPLWRLWQGN